MSSGGDRDRGPDRTVQSSGVLRRLHMGGHVSSIERALAVDIVITRRRTDDRWMTKAACRGMTHLFFPAMAERPQARERREAEARQVCRSCIVADTCREFARENHEYGLWGGESEEERHNAGFRLIAPIGIRAVG